MDAVDGIHRIPAVPEPLETAAETDAFGQLRDAVRQYETGVLSVMDGMGFLSMSENIMVRKAFGHQHCASEDIKFISFYSCSWAIFGFNAPSLSLQKSG